MAPYSMDLRERVVRVWDASGDADEIAATFAVSRAWVHRLVQRRRETGSIAPRKQTKFRSRVLAGQEARLAALILARPDATLAELREALPTTASLSTLAADGFRGLCWHQSVIGSPFTFHAALHICTQCLCSGAERNLTGI
jgi:Transposase